MSHDHVSCDSDKCHTSVMPCVTIIHDIILHPSFKSKIISFTTLTGLLYSDSKYQYIWSFSLI